MVVVVVVVEAAAADGRCGKADKDSGKEVLLILVLVCCEFKWEDVLLPPSSLLPSTLFRDDVNWSGLLPISMLMTTFWVSSASLLLLRLLLGR